MRHTDTDETLNESEEAEVESYVDGSRLTCQIRVQYREPSTKYGED